MFSEGRASQPLVLSNYVFTIFGLLLRLFQIEAQGVSVVAPHSFGKRVKSALQSTDSFTLIWQVLKRSKSPQCRPKLAL